MKSAHYFVASPTFWGSKTSQTPAIAKEVKSLSVATSKEYLKSELKG